MTLRATSTDAVLRRVTAERDELSSAMARIRVLTGEPPSSTPHQVANAVRRLVEQEAEREKEPWPT